MDRIIKLDNKECLYRRILSNSHNDRTPDQYTIDDITGEISINSTAFLGGKKPSVDIASINNYVPSKTKRSDTDGIISFTVGDVRSIEIIGGRKADVEPTPDPCNKAHAEIYITTKSNSNSLSDLRRGLAKRSTVKIKPVE